MSSSSGRDGWTRTTPYRATPFTGSRCAPISGICGLGLLTSPVLTLPGVDGQVSHDASGEAVDEELSLFMDRARAPEPPPAAPYSLQDTVAALVLGFGASVLVQQQPSPRQWGLVAVAAAVAACGWAVWWLESPLSTGDAAARRDAESDEREREVVHSRAEVQASPERAGDGVIEEAAASGQQPPLRRNHPVTSSC